MAEPISIIGSIQISETALKEFLNTKQQPFSCFTDWTSADFISEKWLQQIEETELKPDPSQKIKQFYANSLLKTSQADFPDDLLLFHYNKKDSRLFYVRTFRYDWYTAARAELMVLRQFAGWKDIDSQDYAFIGILPPYACALREIYALLIVEKNNSCIKPVHSYTDEELIVIKDKLITAYSYHIESAFGKEQHRMAGDALVAHLYKKKLVYSAIYREYVKLKKKYTLRNLPELIARASPDRPLYLDKDIYTDGKHVFGFSDMVLEDADPLTIRRVSDFIIDKHNVYCANGAAFRNLKIKVEGANATHFTLLKNPGFKYDQETLYWQDDQHIYYGYYRLPGAIPDSYTFEGKYLVSGGYVFSNEKRCDDLDAHTFKAIGLYYYTDRNGVFHDSGCRKTELMPLADAATFEPLIYAEYEEGDIYDLDHMAKDAHYVYYHERIIEQADPITFKRIGPDYGLDKNYLFKKDNLVPGSHASSYVNMALYFAKDNNQVYYQGIPVPGADVNTFEVIGESAYGKDKNAIYYQTEIINDADRASFRVISWFEAKDKSRRYYYGK